VGNPPPAVPAPSARMPPINASLPGLQGENVAVPTWQEMGFTEAPTSIFKVCACVRAWVNGCGGCVCACACAWVCVGVGKGVGRVGGEGGGVDMGVGVDLCLRVRVRVQCTVYSVQPCINVEVGSPTAAQPRLKGMCTDQASPLCCTGRREGGPEAPGG